MQWYCAFCFIFVTIEIFFFPTLCLETWVFIQLLNILFLGEASMSPGLEAGKHFVGWKPSSSAEDM